MTRTINISWYDIKTVCPNFFFVVDVRRAHLRALL
jgi:D-mannonate dehydratase